jgi:hypothetical protein
VNIGTSPYRHKKIKNAHAAGEVNTLPVSVPHSRIFFGGKSIFWCFGVIDERRSDVLLCDMDMLWRMEILGITATNTVDYSTVV